MEMIIQLHVERFAFESFDVGYTLFSCLQMNLPCFSFLSKKKKMHIYVRSPPNRNVNELALTPSKMFKVVYLKASIVSKLDVDTEHFLFL